MCGKSPRSSIPNLTSALLSLVVVTLETPPTTTTRKMRVVGAFIDLRVSDLAVEIMSDLPNVDLADIGTTAEEIVDHCSEHPTDVILVNGDFLPHVNTVRTTLANRGVSSPLWIAIVGPPKVYSRQIARELDIHVELHVDDFTYERWHAAVHAASQYSRCNSPRLRVVTAISSESSSSALADRLGPWGFHFGVNSNRPEELLTSIFLQQPHLVIFDESRMDDIVDLCMALPTFRAGGAQLVLMLTTFDPALVIHAAINGIRHMFTACRIEPAEDLAALLRSFVDGKSEPDSPLVRIVSTVALAKDDDDRAILRLLATGATNDGIAHQIFASEQSVKNRLSRLMKAARVSNRTELALLLTGTKLPPPPQLCVDRGHPSRPIAAVA
jgi:DNA-binding NarL/FixJ family response regulator